jgi:hypothetical protein
MRDQTPTRTAHKRLSLIEGDIREYYQAGADAELTALSIACRALGIALDHVEPVNVEPVTTARELVYQLILNRTAELSRAAAGVL